jgi:hypothetical protein
MSADYYVRLELARGPRPSRQMLAAIARALRLSDDERDHLFRLGGEAQVERGPSRDVPAGIVRLLDGLQEIPALVCDATYEVLAWNPMAVIDRGLLGPDGAGAQRRVALLHQSDRAGATRSRERGGIRSRVGGRPPGGHRPLSARPATAGTHRRPGSGTWRVGTNCLGSEDPEQL